MSTPHATDNRLLLEGLPARYRLLRLLGAGGFGAVYLATDEVLQREVAIKVLTGGDSADRESLRREARALAAVSHANIVNVLDVLALQYADALVLEYVSGGTIGSVLETAQIPPRDQALRWIHGVSAALAAVHGAGLVHCDLKPDNVLVDAGGNARLTDFGVARLSNDPLATAAGSLGYAAPEVMLGEAPSTTSDLYSLGVVAWEVLTGRRAFEATQTLEVLRHQTTATLPSLSSVASDLPAEIRDVLARCLEADPAKRPASAHEVRDILARNTPRDAGTRALDGLGITAVVPVVVLACLLITLAATWIDVSDLSALPRPSLRRRNLKFFKLLAEGALLLVATGGLFASGIQATVRRLQRARSAAAPMRVVDALREIFAPPRWWPTWYPGHGVPAEVRVLPDSIRRFRVLVWWGLPIICAAMAALLILALGRPPVVGMLVARVAVGTALFACCLALGWLINIVVTYRESPMYDAFELAAIAVARPVRVDVARALPFAATEAQLPDDPVDGPWYRRLMWQSDTENQRVAHSSTAQRVRSWSQIAVGLLIVGWVGLLVIKNYGQSLATIAQSVFD